MKTKTIKKTGQVSLFCSACPGLLFKCKDHEYVYMVLDMELRRPREALTSVRCACLTHPDLVIFTEDIDIVLLEQTNVAEFKEV